MSRAEGTLFDLLTPPSPSLPPSISPCAHLFVSLPSWLCWQGRHPHPFTLHPAVHLGSFLCQRPPLLWVWLFGKACLENVFLLNRRAFTPPPPRLCYILSNKPERTNISSLQILPLALKPHFNLGINIWFTTDLNLTLNYILCMHVHFPNNIYAIINIDRMCFVQSAVQPWSVLINPCWQAVYILSCLPPVCEFILVFIITPSQTGVELQCALGAFTPEHSDVVMLYLSLISLGGSLGARYIRRS